MVQTPKLRNTASTSLSLPPGRLFLRLLKSSFDASRLSRGREIFEQDRVLEVSWGSGLVESQIKGRPRPYREERSPPVYKAWLRFAPLPEAQLVPVLDQIGSRVDMAAQLVSHDLRWSEDQLLPRQFESACSCPDARNPCKHIAALCFHMARCLDRDPLILFELRGMMREEVENRLLASPLGIGVLSALKKPLPLPEMRDAFFTQPMPEKVPEFWTESDYRMGPPGRRVEAVPPALGIPGMLVRKGGDYPGFWEGEESFVRVMDGLYAELRRRLSGTF